MTAAKATLTYNYGDTPEEVIRERYDACVNQHAELIVPAYGVFHGVTALLTVLDALVAAAEEKRRTLPVAPYPIEVLRCEALRISILAALGITEG